MPQLWRIVTCIGPNQKNQTNLDLYLVRRYIIAIFPQWYCIFVSVRTQRTNLIWFCIWFGDPKYLYLSQPCQSPFIVYLRLALLQLGNDGPVSKLTTRDVSKSHMWKFFSEGEKKEEGICLLCPKLTVIRKQEQGRSTSNQMRHLKKFHLNELRRVMEECWVWWRDFDWRGWSKKKWSGLWSI